MGWDKRLTENLSVRIRGGHFAAEVCYGIPSQDQKVNSGWAWKHEVGIMFYFVLYQPDTSLALKILFTNIKLIKETTSN